ncbi:MAG: TonB-dependent receptor [Saprospiraceae bacterium]
MKCIYLLFLTLFFVPLHAQQVVVISGICKDASNGETLLGANVELVSTIYGTTSNDYGFYSLSIPAQDSGTIRCSYLGYDAQEYRLPLMANQKLQIRLNPGSSSLQEVVVTANSNQERMLSTKMSVERITVQQAKLIPALFGEVDIIKTIQLKPGINSGTEGSSGLFVRGGNLDQNLIILDEAVVYNANHLFGFFSTFNADAIKDVQVFKGGFPAEYGGRLSSVIDVQLKDGNNQKFAGSGGLGLIASRLTLEGPIQKDKSSFIISGRRTYVDLFTRAINKSNKDNPESTPIPNYNFYDLNAKLNFQLGEKDRLFFSGYLGQDVFKFEDNAFDFDFNWGNTTATARWNHIFSNKLFSNTTATFSDYQYTIANRVTGFSFKLDSKIRDYRLKTDFDYALNPKHSLNMGLEMTYHEFTVGRIKAGTDNGDISFSAGQLLDGIEYAAYVADEWTATEKLKISTGLRLSAFSNEGQFYARPEPRIAARYLLDERWSLKASYAKMNQYIHLVSNSGISLPTDIWYPSTKNVKPESSDQFALGVNYLLGKGFLLNHEVYYKHYSNLIDFVDHAQLFANDDLEQEFSFGKGYAYGTEFSIEKNEGKLTGWIGYTLAWVKRGEFSFMDGRYFSPRYDRRHNLTVVAMYQWNKRISTSATFIFGNGDKGWLPAGRFAFQDVPGGQFQPVVPVYGDRNTFQMPDYHRLDLGIVIKFFPKWGESDLTISVYNAYSRRNAFFIYLAPEYASGNENPVLEVPERIAAKQVTLFPILPSLTYNFKF